MKKSKAERSEEQCGAARRIRAVEPRLAEVTERLFIAEKQSGGSPEEMGKRSLPSHVDYRSGAPLVRLKP